MTTRRTDMTTNNKTASGNLQQVELSDAAMANSLRRYAEWKPR